MLNPFVQHFLSKNRRWRRLRPKIPVELPEQYAQAGEDLIIQSLLVRLNYGDSGSHKQSFGLEKVRYLEIGANHPVATSSTYLLSRKGAKGILVEANPAFGEILGQVRAADRVLAVACVDDDSDSVELHLSEASELSSVIVEAPMRWADRFNLKETIRVPAMNINEVAQFFWSQLPDDFHTYISIDCEGMDFRIVAALDVERFPFDIIQIEPGEPLTPKNLEAIEKNLSSRGYALVALTEVNAFFVHRVKFKID